MVFSPRNGRYRDGNINPSLRRIFEDGVIGVCTLPLNLITLIIVDQIIHLQDGHHTDFKYWGNHPTSGTWALEVFRRERGI